MINMIVCADLNGAIGYQNKLLCHLGDDMKHFKEKTLGHKVIMGSKTYESLDKPLEGRGNIILTRDRTKYLIDMMIYPNVNAVGSIETILKFDDAYPFEQLFVIGGSQVFEQFLPYTQRVYLTTIIHQFEKVDTFFPVEIGGWETVSKEFYGTNDRNEYPFYISTLERKH